MKGAIEFERIAHARGEGISPALREFIDDVIVPALVRAYLEERNASNVIAVDNGAMVMSPADDRKPCEVSP